MARVLVLSVMKVFVKTRHAKDKILIRGVMILASPCEAN